MGSTTFTGAVQGLDGSPVPVPIHVVYPVTAWRAGTGSLVLVHVRHVVKDAQRRIGVSIGGVWLGRLDDLQRCLAHSTSHVKWLAGRIDEDRKLGAASRRVDWLSSVSDYQLPRHVIER